MDKAEQILMDMVVELRKGVVAISVLSQLKEPQYGYQLAKDLEQKGVPMDTNTLYPLLRRLEGQGLLESLWDTEDSKPRKYYRRTDMGSRVLSALWQQWQTIVDSLNGLRQEGESK